MIALVPETVDHAIVPQLAEGLANDPHLSQELSNLLDEDIVLAARDLGARDDGWEGTEVSVCVS